jgi:signal transduction histidine kinase/ligand-binding sensor domain-containing protein
LTHHVPVRSAHKPAIGWLFALLLVSRAAFALNLAADISQYAHTAWKIRDGFIDSPIRAITQTADGYLWLGTEDGLFRFDGVKVARWQPPAGTALPSTFVRSLLSSRDGTLWIGTLAGLASVKEGRVTNYPALAGMGINGLAEDHEGVVWAGVTAVPFGRVCAIRGASVTCGGDVGRWATTVQEVGGYVWAATEAGLWRWSPGAPQRYRLNGSLNSIVQAFTPDGTGGLLVTTPSGLHQFRAGSDAGTVLSVNRRGESIESVLRDRDGGVWMGTNKGLVHFRNGRTESFSRSDGLSGDVVPVLFEDREGTIWAASSDGLDRFRDYVVLTFSERQGLSTGFDGAVLGARDGSVWLMSNGGRQLMRWHNGGLSVVSSPGATDRRVGSFFEDSRDRIWVSATDRLGYFDHERFVTVPGMAGGNVNAIAEDAHGNLWVAYWTLGLFRLGRGGDVQQIPWSRFSRQAPASGLAADPARGGLWLGFTNGGVAYWADEQVRASYSAANGLGAGRVNDLRVERDSGVWVATAGGLSRIKDGGIVTMTRRHGLPCDGVNAIIDDGAGSLWLYLTCGLAKIARDDLAAWAAASANNPQALPAIHATVFNSTDGLRSLTSLSSYTPHATRSADGRLWLATFDGVSVLDPHHLPFNQLPPPVHVEQVVANRIAHDVASLGGGPLQLPPLTGDLQIDYTALSLVAPERVMFRYKLEGWDADWREAGTRRQAFYTNLPPRTYRFRVTASNNSGVWNDTGASLEIAIAPRYYQTAWFWPLVAGVVLASLWGTHRLRVRVVEKHEREITVLNERLMKAQEQERMRIAGELHDGVAQEMLAVTMMLGTAKRRMPADSPAMATLDKIQQKMIQVGTDIRQISHDLHPPVLQEAGLPEAIRSYCQEFTATSGIAIGCDADEGARKLSRGAALALYRILQEALGNAVKHAGAKRMSVRLTQSDGGVTLTVSDNGVGFDRTRVAPSAGMGLVTMRERASQLGGTFDIESAPTRGTTVTVTIPFR